MSGWAWYRAPWLIVAIIAGLSACSDDDRDNGDGDFEWDLPEGFPAPLVPEDNPMSAAKVELGRYLFYDTQLSGNQTQSCGSCHVQNLAFADGEVTTTGSTGEALARNSMGLTNAGYGSTLTWASPLLLELEEQALVPMFGEFPVELGITGNEDEVLARFASDPLYADMFG
ncbi:MAG: cytochrome c peroxidase, partial [Myxococcota bacterium]